MGLIKKKIGKQGRWPQTLFLFFLPLMLFFSLRWLLLEPFVIPSESMVPHLFIHDHILVQKNAYGIKPFWGDGWFVQWARPQRGDVVVFRYPENREIFFIKRLIGLPGDQIETNGMDLKINGELVDLKEIIEPLDEISTRLEDQPEATYFEENLSGVKHFVRFESEKSFSDQRKIFVVPENSYFVMGDNRFNSHDSRFWGFVDNKYLVGKARLIWLSCDEMLESTPFVCDPKTIRFERLLKAIK